MGGITLEAARCSESFFAPFFAVKKGGLVTASDRKVCATSTSIIKFVKKRTKFP